MTLGLSQNRLSSRSFPVLAALTLTGLALAGASAADAHTAAKVDAPRLEITPSEFRVSGTTIDQKGPAGENARLVEALKGPLKTLREESADKTRLLLVVDDETPYRRLTNAMYTAGRAGWSSFGLRIGDAPVVDLDSPTLEDAETCFNRAETSDERESCWQKVSGQKDLNLTLALSETGADVAREGDRLSLEDDCQGASVCRDGDTPTDIALHKLYNALSELRDEVQKTPDLYRDLDQIILSLPPEAPVAGLRELFLANCRLDKPRYDTSKAYRKALPAHCHDRRFPTLILAITN